MSYKSPNALSFLVADKQSIWLVWDAVADAVLYEVRVDGFRDVMRTVDTRMKIAGLHPLIGYVARVRAVFADNEIGEWSAIDVRTSYGIPPSTVGAYSVVEPIVGYNNRLYIDLPDYSGISQSCTLRLVWHTTDSGWWADLEVPTGTPAILNRRLGLNCGILDNSEGIVAGNIVMRSASVLGVDEPGIDCFKNKTHELRWEPLQ